MEYQIAGGAKMAEIDLKIMFDDVRARDAALFNAIAASDRQSVALFRIYATMVLALVSAIAATAANGGISGGEWLIAGAGVAAGSLSLGCWMCFQAIKTAKVTPPGRAADFWTWARHEDVSDELVIKTYLERSQAAQDTNHDVNAKSAEAIRNAKLLGMWGIGLGAAIALTGFTGLPAYLATCLHPLG